MQSTINRAPAMRRGRLFSAVLPTLIAVR